MKAHIIIQARLGSMRLPGKVLLKVLDKTMLEYVLERVKRAKTIEGIVVATTIKKEDLPIVNLVSRLGINVYCGSEEDVLDRYYQAACSFEMKHIVRITADCPLIDPKVVDAVVQYYFKSDADFCANNLNETFPNGQDLSVFSFDVLKYAWKNARLVSEREHVTPYIEKQTDRFKLVNFENKVNLSAKRWTLDTKEDFEFIKAILESLYPANPKFGMDDILQFLQSNPHLEQINKGIVRNEGYLKSLREDRVIDIDSTE